MTSEVDKVPQALLAQITNLHVIPNRIVLVNVSTADTPYASANGSVNVLNDRVTQVKCSVGYMDQINIPRMLTDTVLTKKDEAAATYYLVDRKIVGANTGELKGLSHKVFSFLHRNASTAAHYFGLPEDRVVSLAVQMDL
jgi:K+ transporter